MAGQQSTFLGANWSPAGVRPARTMPQMRDDHARPSPLGGLWACVVGGLLLAVLLVFLDPVSGVRDCPNYGGNGNASAYPDPAWDLFFPLLTLLWVSSVVVEQFLAETWQHRSRTEGAVRALVAVGSSMYASFFLVVSFAAVCH
jgi:hypothetical protein